MGSKKKTKTYAQLKKEADRVFSIWVRQRDADERGVTGCVTCSLRTLWPKLQCGHWLSRRFMGTRYEPTNCAAQCPSCNRMQKLDGRNAAIFGRAIITRYGQAEYDRLLALSKGVTKLGKTDLRDLIERYSVGHSQDGCVDPGAYKG